MIFTGLQHGGLAVKHTRKPPLVIPGQNVFAVRQAVALQIRLIHYIQTIAVAQFIPAGSVRIMG